MVKFVPALRTMMERIGDILPGPIEGWALVDLNVGPGEIATNSNGPCVFATKSECENLLSLWSKARDIHTDEYSPLPQLQKSKFLIRPVRITLDQGLVFLDDGEEPVVRPVCVPTPSPYWLREAVEDPHMLFDQFAANYVWGNQEAHPMAYDAALSAWVEAAQYFTSLR
jgi:hypothetical protein